jgi:Uma2 family endonuclease
MLAGGAVTIRSPRSLQVYGKPTAMATTKVTKLYTAEDLWEMGDDARVELLEGELIDMGSPTNEGHGSISGIFAWAIGDYAMRTNAGRWYTAEPGFVLARNPDVVLAPDVAFVRMERVAHGEQRQRYIEGAPDLAIEVISPSDRASVVSAKVVSYLDAGTSLVWVADPLRRIVTVYTRDGAARIVRVGDDLDGGDVLPGFSLPLETVFGR